MMTKLTKLQQHVVGRMNEGWALGLSTGIAPNAWLQQNGLGRGGATEKVNIATFSGLHRRGVIRNKNTSQFPSVAYVLTEKWTQGE